MLRRSQAPGNRYFSVSDPRTSSRWLVTSPGREKSTRLVHGELGRCRQQRLSGPKRKTMSANVARLGSARASAVRADRCRTVSGDGRRDGRIWLSHADFVGRCEVGSGYRLGLQAGGHRFDPGTLHSAEKSGRFAAMVISRRSVFDSCRSGRVQFGADYQLGAAHQSSSRATAFASSRADMTWILAYSTSGTRGAGSRPASAMRT